VHEQPADHGSHSPTDRRAMLAGLGGLAAGALLSGGRTAHAGPLTPPAGPIAPTMKRLDEVEPRRPINASTTPGNPFATYRISQPGSYYLTQNLIGEPGKRTIEIASSNVTLDLNGFEVRGWPGSYEGIRAVAPDMRAVVIRNGIVRNASTGSPSKQAVDLSTVSGAVVEGVIVNSSGQGGIAVGDDARVIGCTVLDSAGHGIENSNNSIVERCVTSNNDGIGISTRFRCTVAQSHSTSNNAGGIQAVLDSSIHDCLTTGNQEFGIDVFQRCVVSQCRASANRIMNIQAALWCVVQNNTAHSATTVGGNEGLGIVVTGAGNRVEGNTCINNPYGLRAVNSGNLIIRNMFHSNTFAIDIAAFNALGPVVGALTNGTTETNNGGYFGDIGSLDPNANFVY